MEDSWRPVRWATAVGWKLERLHHALRSASREVSTHHERSGDHDVKSLPRVRLSAAESSVWAPASCGRRVVLHGQGQLLQQRYGAFGRLAPRLSARGTGTAT